jgi:hypothetical protein
VAYITLYGERLTLNGIPIVLYGGSADGGHKFYRSPGKRQTFWQRQAEEWIAENIASVEKAPPARKRAVVVEMLDEPLAMDFLPLPVIAALQDRMAAPAPDYTAIADALLAELMALKAANKPWRDKRDVEALMVLGW